MSSPSNPTERLESIDEHGWKKIIIPADVQGRYRTRRTLVQSILLLIFLLAPWLRYDGHQALLLDLSHRQFFFLGLKLYAHDTPLLFLVVGAFAFGLIFVTSVWGRIWCGWACPQTVFIDGVFRRLEAWIEGSYRDRRQMLVSPLTWRQTLRKMIKWGVFFLVSAVIAHSFVAVFIGSARLLQMMGSDPRVNWDYFVLILSFTALILFDFGWFREQFCIIMCPYGRFQSVLMDSTSLAVIYDEKRGEPRKGTQAPHENAGDCVSCRRCVEVCPTGIDIRRGVQMECIACTNCIDACDEIMEKVKKPKGLIRYSTLRGQSWQIFKPRAILSGLLMLTCLAALGTILHARAPMDVTVLRARQPLFIDISTDPASKRYANQFHLHIRNQTDQRLTVQLKMQNPTLAIATQSNPFDLAPDEDRQIPFFVQFPDQVLSSLGEATDQLHIGIDGESRTELERTIHLEGPVKK